MTAADPDDDWPRGGRDTGGVSGGSITHRLLLLDLESRRLRALVDGDLEAAAELHADDYELINPGGVAVSKQEYLGGVTSGELNYHVFEVASEVAVKSFDDVGILRYRARIEVDFPGGHDSGMFWHTDVYERRQGHWQAVWSQATRISE